MTTRHNVAQKDKAQTPVMIRIRIKADLYRRARHLEVDGKATLRETVEQGMALRLAQLEKEGK